MVEAASLQQISSALGAGKAGAGPARLAPAASARLQHLPVAGLCLLLACLFGFGPLEGPQQKLPFFSFARPESVPAITEPGFVPAAKAENFLKPEEPVLGVVLGGEARAYSLWQLERHLVVNDRFGSRAVAVTWCPFSQTAVVYARRVGERDLTLESDGRLLHDALLLRDRETGTVWAQATGQALEGPLLGSSPLQPLPALQTTWKVWKQEQPETLALEKAGADRQLLSSSYAAYYADPARFGLGHTELKEPRMGGKALVVGITSGSDRLAIPLERLKRDWVVNAVVDRQAVAALYDSATETVRVVRREARGRTISLHRGHGDLFGRPTPPHLVDQETASSWDFTGRAVSGRFQGHQLPLFPYRQQFWYAWQAYFPCSRVE